MTVTVLGELTAPVVTLSLVAGGSLDPSTTYYIRVLAGTAQDSRYRWRGSIPSVETSIVTDGTNKSIKVDWTTPTGATAFWVFISKISGNYTGATCLSQYTGGKTGTTYTILGTETKYANTTMPFAYSSAMPFGLNKERGRIEIDFTGTTTLKNIYDAIVAAGYADSVFFDAVTATFVMHGSFYHAGSTTAALTQYNGKIMLVCGNWGCANTNMTITLGKYSAINFLGTEGCIIETPAQGGPMFANFTSGKIYLYGCYIKSIVGETIAGGVYNPYSSIGAYVHQRTAIYFDGAVVDTGGIFQFFSSVSDFYCKMTAQVDLNGAVLTRVTVAGPFIVGYYASTGDTLRDCISTKSMGYGGLYDVYIACTTAEASRPIKFYNHTLKHKTSINDLIITGSGVTGTPVSFYFSLDVKVVDTSGVPITGVTVRLINDTGTETYTLTTDVNGYITQTNLLYLYCNNPVLATYYFYTKNYHSPHTITISKSGYITKVMKLTMDRKREEIVVLENRREV